MLYLADYNEDDDNIIVIIIVVIMFCFSVYVPVNFFLKYSLSGNNLGDF